jgi:hypothetical protein
MASLLQWILEQKQYVVQRAAQVAYTVIPYYKVLMRLSQKLIQITTDNLHLLPQGLN